MKLNNRFIFGILSLVLAAVIAFVALPTIARQTNGKAEIIRITQPVLKGEKITSDNAEVVEVGGYNLPSNVAHSMEDVAKFAKKVLGMNQARVFMYDDTEKVFAHASEIEQMGLAVPQVTRVFMRLAEMGYPVNPHTYTIKAAKEQILDLFDQKEKEDRRNA